MSLHKNYRSSADFFSATTAMCIETKKKDPFVKYTAKIKM